MPMAMAQHCLCIKSQRLHLFLEGEDQLPDSSSERGGVPSCQMSTIPHFLKPSQCMVDIWMCRVSFLSFCAENDRCKFGSLKSVWKVWSKFIWTLPTGVTSSWQRTPVSTCFCKTLYIRALQSSQPCKSGHSCPHLMIERIESLGI